jgi:hypothetical protein
MQGHIFVGGYCQGCPYADLSVNTTSLYSDNVFVKNEPALCCTHERACERMFKKFGEQEDKH